jgi:hypothetical protein
MNAGNNWIIRSGSDQYVVRPGQSVVIGRKPIRRLPPTDTPRFEFEDSTKTVSKVHAQFKVTADGKGYLTDLGSTNGTYEIRDDGGFTPLPAQTDYEVRSDGEALTTSFRFGDATVTFECVDDTPSDDTDSRQLNLFSQAAHSSHDEDADVVDIDSPAFSVSDILEVRTGEPTVAFQRLPEQIAHVQPQVAIEEEEPVIAEHVESLEPVMVQQQAQPEPQTQAQPEYAPVYEPGSVFDRITKGELKNQAPAVVIGNLDSNLAAKTADTGQQYEMAQHREFLPFLALNPSLYDDLYAWLEAINDPEINRALENNTGYHTYKENKS